MLNHRHIGKPCAFHGFDGKLYQATVVRIRRGIAHIVYPVTTSRGEVYPVHAYIPRADHGRIRFPDFTGRI